jgi:hypothetical protein
MTSPSASRHPQRRRDCLPTALTSPGQRSAVGSTPPLLSLVVPHRRLLLGRC